MKHWKFKTSRIKVWPLRNLNVRKPFDFGLTWWPDLWWPGIKNAYVLLFNCYQVLKMVALRTVIFFAIRENQVGWADYSPTSSVRVNTKELPELLLAGAGANACLERLHDKPDGYVGEFQYMIDMLGKVSQLSVRVSTPALKKCPHAVSKRSGQVRGTGSTATGGESEMAINTT